MIVAELIEKLKMLPQGREVVLVKGDDRGEYYRPPNPEQIFDDEKENFVVVL